jgi:serine/threonine-protein kinase RsbW
MAGEYRLDGVAVPDVLEELHALLERVGREHADIPAEDLMLFETAVIEIAGNVVEHGRPPGEVPYAFELTVHPDRIEALLSDTGQAADLPEDPGMPSELAEEGRGLALADLALDELTYQRQAGENRWHMTRRRRPGASVLETS